MLNRMRIWWTAARYGLWLDLYSVPGRVRRDMVRELHANLADASSAIGVTRAVDNLGSLRGLAREAARDGRLRSPWLAGLSAAVTTFAITMFAFFALSLYYVEGVLDTEVTATVSGSLFPFPGSSVTVDANGAAGFSFEVFPGLLPVVSAMVVFVLVAKPWRAVQRSRSSMTA